MTVEMGEVSLNFNLRMCNLWLDEADSRRTTPISNWHEREIEPPNSGYPKISAGGVQLFTIFCVNRKK
ncbi:hypothetical protein J6590_083846 [Homalodisca vitripennis]|nr:hypothetical protein J6590_083846 [Homalodisca vitripennis]